MRPIRATEKDERMEREEAVERKTACRPVNNGGQAAIPFRSSRKPNSPPLAKIRLTNRGRRPYELSVRNDGAPYALVCMIASNGKDEFDHDQWIRRSGPQKHQLVLAPGDSTSGDVLVFFGPPTGFSFGEPGIYHLRFAFQPDPGFAPVYTNRIEITVVPDDLQNRPFLEELSELAYEYFGYDREVVRRNAGDSILIGYELIHEMLKVQKSALHQPCLFSIVEVARTYRPSN
ncbi:MAG: hypothetical protein IH987_17740 [Planctomycetes bacterium]|nr:hypothetical protein [Planctomycetota bacterium]